MCGSLSCPGFSYANFRNSVGTVWLSLSANYHHNVDKAAQDIQELAYLYALPKFSTTSDCNRP